MNILLSNILLLYSLSTALNIGATEERISVRLLAASRLVPALKGAEVDVVCVTSNGRFKTLDGYVLAKDSQLQGYFPKDSKKPIYLVVTLLDEDNTSLATLRSVVRRLREAVPSSVRVVMFVRLKALDW